MLQMYDSKIRLVGLLFSLSIASLFVSCEEEIDLELNDQENQRIVVEGRITNEFRHHQVRLTKTLSYFEHELVPPLLGADVFITEEGTGNSFPLSLINDSLGIYETILMAGKTGERYSLNIQYDEEEFIATAQLDTLPAFDSLKYEYVVYQYFGMKFGMYVLKSSFYEPPPEGSIYRLDVFLNDTLYTDGLSGAVYFDDFQTNDMYWPEIEIYAIPQERIRLDTNRVRLEMYSISRDEYNFLAAFFAESFSGFIFSGPPANIPTNVKNTAGGIDGVGFFAASGKSTIEIELIKEHDESTNNPFYDQMKR
jgi:hypothetical protein